MAIAVAFFLGIASFGLVLTLFLQIGMGFTPLHAGLTFLPFSAACCCPPARPPGWRRGSAAGVTMTGALIIAAGMACADRHRAPLRRGRDAPGTSCPAWSPRASASAR